MTAVPCLMGDPRHRGLAFARLGSAHADAVRDRALAARDFAASIGAEGWLESLWQAQQRLLPEVTTFVEGLAEGYGVRPQALFVAHARYAVEDRAAAATDSGADGCSVIAVTTPYGDTLLAKNRDNPPAMRPFQSLLRQVDPGWNGREILCVGSFGSVPAISSGINSDGFCMADTAVRTADLGIGALRYYVMEALLTRCGSVAEALSLLRALPHLGGGTLELADAAGAMAAVELGHHAMHVEHRPGPGWIARTNHFLAPDLAAMLREPPGSAPRLNSEGRLALLHGALDAGIADWRVEDCADLLSRHASAGAPALCRHDAATETASCTIFEPAARRLRVSQGQPCGGIWTVASLSPSSHQESP